MQDPQEGLPIPLPSLTSWGEGDEQRGAVLELDDDGVILSANDHAREFLDATEAELIGKDLREAAPWTSNQMFWGKFRRGVDDDQMDIAFPYLLMTSSPHKTLWVRMVRSSSQRRNWVFMHTAGC